MSVEIGIKRTNPAKGKPFIFEVTDSGCIVCTSHSPNKDGYIRIFVSNFVKPRQQFLHRILWQDQHGLIEKGYELDHKCRNRKCCNIEHLQKLTISEHKTKTNLERYAERIANVKKQLSENVCRKTIAKNNGITLSSVCRIRKTMENG